MLEILPALESASGSQGQAIKQLTLVLWRTLTMVTLQSSHWCWTRILDVECSDLPTCWCGVSYSLWMEMNLSTYL